MLPPQIKVIINQIENSIEKATRSANERNNRSTEQQAAVSASIQRLTDELKTYDEKQNAREDGKTRRENKTIIALAAAAVFTLVLDGLSACQLEEMKKA